MLAQTAVGTGHVGGRRRQLDVAAHHLEILAGPDILLGIEIGKLAAEGKPQAAVAAVLLQPPHAAAAGAERSPIGLFADADRADYADPGDGDFLHERHQ